MTERELGELVRKQASQAYDALLAAKKMSPMKRAKALDAAYRKQGAVDLACDILGEDIATPVKEERIKAIFYEAFHR